MPPVVMAAIWLVDSASRTCDVLMAATCEGVSASI